MIKRVEGKAPFVVDRGMPSIFETAPGSFTLIAKAESDTPMTFDTHDDAEGFLKENVPTAERDTYVWRILPVEKVGDIEDASEWEAKENLK